MKKMIFGLAAVVLVGGCDSGGSDVAEPAATASEAALATATKAPAAAATPATKEEALALMKARHENYEDIGDAMKVITRELKADAPDLDQVRTAAATMARLAPQVPSWFPAGTGPDVGKTEAKAEIWQKPEDFAAKAKAFADAAAAFDVAAKGGDLAAIKAAQGELGKSCKGCHDLYREEE